MAEIDTRLVDLCRETSSHADDMAQRWHRLQYETLAGKTFQCMGKPVRFTAHWPEGLPRGFADEEAFTAWVRAVLAEMRGDG